jgi:hypothetical protein
VSAAAFLQVLTGTLFVLIFLIVAVGALRQPRHSSLDASLFFGAAALIVVVSWILQILDVPEIAIVTVAIGSVLMALPYLLLRLVDDFSGVPRRFMV